MTHGDGSDVRDVEDVLSDWGQVTCVARTTRDIYGPNESVCTVCAPVCVSVRARWCHQVSKSSTPTLQLWPLRGRNPILWERAVGRLAIRMCLHCSVTYQHRNQRQARWMQGSTALVWPRAPGDITQQSAPDLSWACCDVTQLSAWETSYSDDVLYTRH